MKRFQVQRPTGRCRAVLALRVPKMRRASSTLRAKMSQARPIARAQT